MVLDLEKVCYLDLGTRYFKIISFNEDNESGGGGIQLKGLFTPKQTVLLFTHPHVVPNQWMSTSESEWWPWTIKLQYYKWSPYDLTFSLIFSLLFDLECRVDHFIAYFFTMNWISVYGNEQRERSTNLLHLCFHCGKVKRVWKNYDFKIFFNIHQSCIYMTKYRNNSNVVKYYYNLK